MHRNDLKRAQSLGVSREVYSQSLLPYIPSMLDPHLLGILAGTFTTAAFVPQAWKVWRTKSAADLSLPTFLIFSAGVVCWLLYGLSIRNTPIILANAMTLAIAVSIIFMALRFRRPPHA